MSEVIEESVSIPVNSVTLPGSLMIPEGATGLVVFAHGSGSSRHSPRNNAVASVIRDRGVGTLLFDLLTEEEDQARENRFDISLLKERLIAVTEWLNSQNTTRDMSVGYFGSSTGAAAALRAAAALGDTIDAVVSRGGRVDLAMEVIDQVSAPTLLIVGGADTQVREYNEDVYEQISAPANLHIVPGADHLFSGEGELDAVADQAAAWFAETLKSDSSHT